jgi:hypothetical protein
MMRFGQHGWIATRRARVSMQALAAAAVLTLAGCSGEGSSAARSVTGGSSPSYVAEPFTHEQQLIEQGARLVVADRCSACHLLSAARKLAPNFSSFAGHRVALGDGRHVIVDERFLREGLLHPSKNRIEGYDAAPMLAALAELDLARHPQQVAALAAFIEQVGPEP